MTLDRWTDHAVDDDPQQLTTGDFAMGQRRSAAATTVGTFATGVRSTSPSTTVGDFASGIRTVRAPQVTEHEFTDADAVVRLAA